MTDVTSLDSGFDAIEGTMSSSEPSIHIRVTMPEDPSFQMIFIICPLDLVWTLKQKVLASVANDLKDSMNYGFYCPPSNNRIGKFLDEERPIKEYPLSVPIGLLEFKYKKKLYKTDLNPLKLKKMHVLSELKIFLELVRKGEIDQITSRMSRGFDPNFNSFGKGETPLTLSATLPRPRAVILALVGGGAFIDYRNRNGLTPLHVATMLGNKDSVRILLDLGSSPNYKDPKGLTPLSYATMKDTPPLCIQWLLQERADIGRRDEKGWMEIHHACELGLTQHLEQLLYYGADRNALTRDSNETPLHICAKFNQGDCAHLLLLRGADKTLKNKSDKTPEQVARSSGHDGVAKSIADFRHEQVELFADVPKYNEKRRGTISMATLSNLQRSRSNPNLLQQLFQHDPVLSATVSHSTGVHYVSNVLIPNGVKSPSTTGRPVASDLFGTGTQSADKNESFESSNRRHIERLIELRRPQTGFGFILRGPIDPPGSTLNFMPTPDVPARQYIESIDPGGAAEKAGLEARDFILEINGLNVVFESHKDCVQLMINCGDLLKLKVVKVQPTTSQIQLKMDHVDKTDESLTKAKDSIDSDSLTSSGSNQAKETLASLEALENLDAKLDSYDGIIMDAAEDQEDNTSVPPPVEFPSEILPVSGIPLADCSDFLPPPPPPAFNETVVEVNNVELEFPEVLKMDEEIESTSTYDSVLNGHLEMPSKPKQDYDVVVSERSLEEKVVVEPSVVKPAEEGGSKKKSASLAFAVANIGMAKEEMPEEPSRTSTVVVRSAGSSEAQSRKKYLAPSVPQSSSPASPTMSSSGVAASSGIVAASVKADDAESKVNRSIASTYSEVSPEESAPIPPPPPPLPPPAAAPVVVGTLSRSKQPSESSGGGKSAASGVQKQLLEETRKRDEGHAALMAAVQKRKNVIDATDPDQLASSIDARVDHTRRLQKTVYRADNKKEVKTPPTTVRGAGLLVSPEGTLARQNTSSVPDGSTSGFSEEADKIRQTFLLKKSAVVESNETSKDGPISPRMSTSLMRGEMYPTPTVNGVSNGGEVKTLNRTNNRPNSSAVAPSQPVLADVASIIAQKALERQKKEEAKALLSQAKLEHSDNSGDKSPASKQMDNRKSMFETSSESAKPLASATLPKLSTSRVYTSGNINGGDGTTAGNRSPSAKAPPAVGTLQPKKYGSNAAVTSSSRITAPAGKGLEESKPSSRTSTIVTSSANSGEKAASVIRSPQPGTTLPRQETGGKTVSVGVIPPPVEFATPAESSFSNDVYATATLRNVSKSTPSNSVVFRARSGVTSEAIVAKSFQDRPISLWSKSDVRDWLEFLDYSDYRAIFAERNISGSTLSQIKGADLESMGIKNPLHRIRIEKEIRKFTNK